jgi:hypothetical protein
VFRRQDSRVIQMITAARYSRRSDLAAGSTDNDTTLLYRSASGLSKGDDRRRVRDFGPPRSALFLRASW